MWRLSVKPPFVNGTAVELGDMRFTEAHFLMCGMARALGLASGAGFKSPLESVSPVRLFTIALCYGNCWWEKVVGGGSNGKSVTDLPMRQVYYWKVNPHDQQGVVLIYDGGLTTSYWEQLDNAKASRPQAKLAGRKEGVDLWAD